MEIEKLDFEVGLTSAKLILEDWNSYGPARKQHIVAHVQKFTSFVLSYIESHNDLPIFAIGYAYGIEESAILELNKIISPITIIPEYKSRKRSLAAS